MRDIRRTNKRLLIILTGILCLMGIGYSAFSSNLKISGTSSVSSSWDIAITGISDAKVEGLAEETHTPTWDRLTASMEADLYQKGDSVSYDVTIENRGTLDATLEDISQNVKSTNEAVRIMFTGYTKGQVLKAKSSQIVTVKIEYNPDFDGNAEEGAGEVSVTFNYTQYEGSTNTSGDTSAPQGKHLVTYNCDYNGGSDTPSILHNQYLSEGSAIDLTPQCTKAGYTFLGWNTDSNSTKPINSINVGNGNVTLYGIYKKTVTATYIKGDNILKIGKDKDSCDMYNKDVSCNIVLPSITPVSDYESLGWYNGNTKVGDTNGTYALNEDITFTSKAGKLEPYMMARNTSKAFWQSTYNSKISTVDVLTNKDVPSTAVASWDVSDKQNKSVIAWIIDDPDNSGMYKLYIGGKGGVIANSNSSYLFYGSKASFSKTTTMNLANLDTSRVTNMSSMFSACSGVTSLDVSNFDTSKVTNMSSMFNSCSSLTSLDVSNFDTSKVTNMSSMFLFCSKLTSLDVSNFDTSEVTNMNYMFGNCSSLTSLDVSNFDTSNVTNMSDMFHRCNKLVGLNISSFNTSKVTNMTFMFYGCSSLTTLDVSNFDTSKVTNMYSMFHGCSSLTTLDVSHFDTSKVMSMYSMFYGCSSLTTLDVSHFDTSQVTSMMSMFSGCRRLITLDLSNFDTSKVTNMAFMFYGCSNLTNLKLCSFDTNNVTNMNSMFKNTSKLTKAYVGPNWTTTNATTTDMFTGSGISSVTQSNNCEIDAEDISVSLNTTSTTNSITAVATASADSGIAKYEFSKDDGKTWIDNGTSNVYTFSNLKNGISVSVDTLKNDVVTSGDGLYADSTETGRYVYRGANPNNYITLGTDTYRIIAIESDNTLKVIKNGSIGSNVFDIPNARHSTTSTDYCNSAYGCKAWGSKTTTLDTNGKNVTQMPWAVGDTLKDLPEKEAYLNTYLNNNWYNSLSSNVKNLIVSHMFNVGVTKNNETNLSNTITQEQTYKWKGKVGLMNPSDYVKASTNSVCTSVNAYDSNSSCYNNSDTHNWIYAGPAAKGYSWTIAPYSTSADDFVFLVFRDGHLFSRSVSSRNGAAPVLYLSSDVKLSGEGTSSSPYIVETSFPIKARATSKIGKVKESDKVDTKLKEISAPIFSETTTSTGKTVTITYPSASGLTKQYQVNGGTWQTASSTTQAVSFTADGTLVAKVTDGTNTMSSSYTVVIDTTAPTVKFGTNGSTTWKKSQSTTVTVTDNIALNTSSLKYLWNQSTTKPSESSFTASFTSGNTITKNTGTGNNWYLWILAKDKAGNTTIVRSNAFYIDNTAPTITANNNSSSNWVKYGTGVVISGKVSDANSGINKSTLYYSYDGSTQKGNDWDTNNGSSYSGTWSASREQQVWVRIADNAGNYSAWTNAGWVKILSAYKSGTLYGDEVGPGPSYFRTVYQYREVDKNDSQVHLQWRCYVEVTSSNFYGTVLENNWYGNFSIYDAGTYGDSGWCDYADTWISYGSTKSDNCNANYSGSNYYSSTASLNFTPSRTG